MSDPRPLVYGQLGGSSRVHILGDGIHVSDSANLDRVHLGRLANGDYGLAVANAGGTVIIDGSSDMFKIAATGTMNITGCDAALGTTCNTTATVDIATGFTYNPTFLGFIEFSSGIASSLPYINTDAGGTGLGTVLDRIRLDTQVVDTNSTRLTTRYTVNAPDAANNRASSTFPTRYYVLEEVAI